MEPDPSLSANPPSPATTPPARPDRRGLRLETRAWFWIVLAAALGSRLALLALYSPAPYGDTPSYWRLAQAIRDGWRVYDGTRTPGYPAFLALAGSDLAAVGLQMACGVAITLLLFYLGLQVSARPWVGGMVALLHTFSLQQLFFESTLLSETLTTFWIGLTFAGLALWLARPARRTLWLALGLGLVSTLAAITRPLFIYLPVWVALFILLGSRDHPWGKAASSGRWAPGVKAGDRPTTPDSSPIAGLFYRLAVFSLPVLLVLGGWVFFIHSRFGDWGLTTMTGFHMIQHTGEYFEYVPDEYAVLRDTYLEYRALQVARRGTPTNAIWEAIPAMSKATGLSFYALNRTLARISARLIWEHPDLFLKNVLSGWWMFWRAPVYWQSELIRLPALAGVLPSWIMLQRVGLFLFNLAFILLSVINLLAGLFFGLRRLTSRASRRDNPSFSGGKAHLFSFKRLRGELTLPSSAFSWCLVGAIWGASVLQTLLDHGDNPRFLVPLQSFLVLWVVWSAAGLIIRRIDQV